MQPDPIARIRRFNRAVTAETGALDTSFLGRGRPLGAARVLWGIGPDGTDVADIRTTLRLDSGLLSRLLRTLEAGGLITTEPARHDRRHRVARLTAAGQTEKAEYDRLNDRLAADILSRVPGKTDAFLAAMDLVANVLNRSRITITPSDPEAPQARACLSAYFTLLTERIPGVTSAHVPDPDPEAQLYRPPGGAFLLALSDGLPVACAALKHIDAQTGEVKRLWVDPSARGMGLARQMMTALEEAARGLGKTRLKLDTNGALTEAIALYRATGWYEIAPYSTFPATHWFAKQIQA
jgi:DNA-binding MarR family transcriptional regulator/GNAT superfamily N-acetyltransferase